VIRYQPEADSPEHSLVFARSIATKPDTKERPKRSPSETKAATQELASARQTMSDIGKRSITPSEAVSYRRTL